MAAPDKLTALHWYFTTAKFAGTILDSGSGPATTETFIKTNSFGNGIPVYSEAFNIGAGVTLTAGTTYWFELDTATSTTPGQAVFWDQSDGPSSAFQTPSFPLSSIKPCNGLCTGSESFQLSGSSVPEPGTVATFGAALAALVALRKRMQSKKSI